MRAFGLDFESRRPSEFDLPDPRIQSPSDVLLRVHEVGSCATDRELASFRFGEPPPGESRLALGHEALAQVIECGGAVAGLRPGDWVVPMIRRSCRPACRACAARRRDLCLTNGYIERGIFRAHGYLLDYAVDPFDDLIPVPPDLVDVAVLVEPLSVVEKACETALRLHPFDPHSVLIYGAGPVGLLSALAAIVRGMECEIVSLEPEDHPNAILARRIGARYSVKTAVSAADIVIEASGAPAALRSAAHQLRPLGVLILIGAAEADVSIPAIQAVVHNLTVSGVVNSGPGHLEAAVSDLRRFPRDAVHAMIERRPAARWRESLEPGPVCKVVHVIE